jgi:hypothetical protein
MEINSSYLNHYIKIYNKILPKDTLPIFQKICKEHFKYEPVGVVNSDSEGNAKIINDTNIRNVTSCRLSTLGEESFTNVHWCSYFLANIKHCLNLYIRQNINSGIKYTIENIDILKYEIGGHYEIHWDHGKHTPRTFSLIYLINDDYEGGDLIFKTPDYKNTLKIEKKANTLLIWPSNFLYPHTVTPVTKGTRYSLVSWAL